MRIHYAVKRNVNTNQPGFDHLTRFVRALVTINIDSDEQDDKKDEGIRKGSAWKIASSKLARAPYLVADVPSLRAIRFFYPILAPPHEPRCFVVFLAVFMVNDRIFENTAKDQSRGGLPTDLHKIRLYDEKGRTCFSAVRVCFSIVFMV